MTDFGLEVARDPTTPEKTLRRLYVGSQQYGHAHITRAVLMNPNTPGDILLTEISRYNVDAVIFNPSLPLLLLDRCADIVFDRLGSHLIECTTNLILAVPREAWLELARDWLGHVALVRLTVHTIPDPRKWGRNVKTLEHSRYNFPTSINTRALIANATWGHENRSGALMVLVERARPLRVHLVDEQANNDEKIDKLDQLLGRPRAEVHASPVPVVVHKGKVESFLRVSRRMDTLPGLDL